MATRKTYINEEGKRIKKPSEGIYVSTETKSFNDGDTTINYRVYGVVKNGEQIFNFRIWDDTEITSVKDVCKILYEIAKSRIYSKASQTAEVGTKPIWFTSSFKQVQAGQKLREGATLICVFHFGDETVVYPGCVIDNSGLVEDEDDRAYTRCIFPPIPYNKFKTAARYAYRLQKLIIPKEK